MRERTLQKFLDSTLNISKMYNLYVEQSTTQNCFRCQLALSLLKTSGTQLLEGQCPAPLPDDVHFDGKSHWIVNGLTE